ncbi:MAG TPA: hypothetical protein DCG12_05680 [Planctomycetaceae bacterium]|nr:hypothetical protein [Planctomycetaceae bacterium]
MNEDKSWEPCPPGTISEVIERQAQQERIWRMSRRSVIGGTLATAAGAILIIADRLQPGAEYRCADVMALADDYVSGRLESGKVELIDQHRGKCQSCDEELTRMMSQA